MSIALRGAVQGVGFRPFVYRLASEMELSGWVLNAPEGVFLEVEGREELLDSFLLRLETEKPTPAFIQSLEYSILDPVPYPDFRIRESVQHGLKNALILPDIATCDECLSEVLTPGNRRYGYPFTNCTHCGPRFSIIESLPYDRPTTSMKSFEMCPDCQKEYEDPGDRRFHAQPNACPRCGPELELWGAAGKTLSRRGDALIEAAEAIRSGAVVAIKGLGGFHLVADARNPAAVETLRNRKRREEKPFALMYPSLERTREECRVLPLEARLLASAESPIVLLERRRQQSELAAAVAPGNPYLGVMLPYTPLHHVLMRELGFPIIATSGNRSDEPICIDEWEARERLSGLADLFLVHNRPIVRHVDDSIVRVVLGRELVLRRARGYAPLPLRGQRPDGATLAVGAHLKNAVALSTDRDVFVSQHIGDLETRGASEAFRRTIDDIRTLYGVEPIRVACDMHPDYLSTKFATKFARESGLECIAVQHHYAHVASCMAENELTGRVLGVAWDGSGYGPDGTVWGGEFLLTDDQSFTRAASIRRFRLPGGTAAVKEPRRTALGILYDVLGDSVFERRDLAPVAAFTTHELSVLAHMLHHGINSPWTTSVGRLFDAVASLAGVRQITRYEGQAAMELEFALDREDSDEAYPFAIVDAAADGDERWRPDLIVDWAPMIRKMLGDVQSCGDGGNGISLARISRKFHNTLVETIVEAARRLMAQRVVLTGGCFQNKFLLETAVSRLRREGFQPYWHQRIPPNDGGLALGQIAAVARLQRPIAADSSLKRPEIGHV